MLCTLDELAVEVLCSFHGTMQVSHCTGAVRPNTYLFQLKHTFSCITGYGAILLDCLIKSQSL